MNLYEGVGDQMMAMMSSYLGVNSLVDEVDGLGFELVGTVQVSQNKNLSSIFHRQTGTQRIFTHDLQSLQSILKKGGQHQCTVPVFTSTGVVLANIYSF